MSRIVLISGLIWVVWLVSRDFDTLGEAFRIDSYAWLLATFVIGVLALLFNVPVFQTLLAVHGNRQVSFIRAANMLFAAQILRHLPGRVWGIAYLVAETKAEIPSTAMVRANLDTMFFAAFFSLLIATALFVGASFGWGLGLTAFLVGSACLALIVRLDVLARCIMLLAHALPKRVRDVVATIAPQQRMPWAVVTKMVGFTSLSWICYLVVWWAFKNVFPVLDDVNIWLLCSAYSAAWFIGYVSMITPSGLGVREASFVAFAGSLTSLSNLAFLAVFIRIWQFAVEIAVFFLFAFVGRRKDKDKPLQSASQDLSQEQLDRNA